MLSVKKIKPNKIHKDEQQIAKRCGWSLSPTHPSSFATLELDGRYSFRSIQKAKGIENRVRDLRGRDGNPPVATVPILTPLSVWLYAPP